MSKSDERIRAWLRRAVTLPEYAARLAPLASIHGFGTLHAFTLRPPLIHCHKGFLPGKKSLPSVMRELIRRAVTQETFAACWEEIIPPYDEFLDAVDERVLAGLMPPVTQLTADARADGANRMRVDGTLRDAAGDKTFYLELVWLPRFGSFRGRATLNEAVPEPTPKTTEQFIAALDSIVDEEKIIFKGQVYDAFAGFNESAPDAVRAYAAIFRLFERFPQEDFGNPGSLVHFMESHGGYECLLENSILREPSIPAVVMVNRLLLGNPDLSDVTRIKWLNLLRDIITSNLSGKEVRALASELLDCH